MTKKVLFSNKMLVLLQKYTKKGETHTLPLAFPPFWAYSMSCFETILFRHSGFPGTANVLLGTLSLPFWGQPDPGRIIRRRKARLFPCLRPRGKMTQNLQIRVGYARSIRGERVSSIACSLPLVWGRKTRAIPYAALGANILLPPLLQRPPGVQERLQQNGAVIHRHAARLFDTEGFLL